MIINITNHPSSLWSNEQLNYTIEEYNEIIDIPFPNISINDDIDSLVNDYYNKVIKYNNPVVLIQGEFVFTYRLVSKLKKNNIKCISGHSKRIVLETSDPTKKTSMFKFDGYLEY